MNEHIIDKEFIEKAEPETFHLEQDNDGHWYVIQDGYENDFHQWINDMENDVDSKFDFEGCRTYGSPSLVHFSGSYWIE